MNKNTLTLALVAASIVVTCAQVVADIRIEAVGVATTHLLNCPDQKTLPVKDFYQYKVFGHFSLLTLGKTLDKAQPAKNLPTSLQVPQTPILTTSQAHGQTQTLAQSAPSKAWNRLTLSIGKGKGNAPLDVFKSSSRSQSSTGTILTYCPAALITDWSSAPRPPMVSIQGNTQNPSGLLVLCVDFVPHPPTPIGQILLNGNPPRNGDKIPIAWKIHR